MSIRHIKNKVFRELPLGPMLREGEKPRINQKDEKLCIIRE